MKHYRVKAEHDDHFEIHDKRDGRTFKVAKKSMDKAAQNRVRKMAGGGLVGEDKDGDGIPDAPTNTQGLLGANFMPSTPQVTPTIPESRSANTASSGDLDKLASKLKGDEKTAGANINTQAPQQTQQDGSMQMASAPMTGMPQAADTGTQDAIKAVQQGMQQQQAAAAQQQRVADQYALDQQKLADQTKLRYAALDDENKVLQADIASSKIDPHRLWNSASTGNKILAGIGVILSGIGSGLSGQQNMAMAVINKAIDADIEAQKADLGKKQNLLSMNYRKYGDIQTAEAATASQLASVVQAQLSSAAAKSGSAQSMLNGKLALAQIQQAADQKIQLAAQNQAKNDIFNAGGGQNLTPATAEAVAPGQWVNTPVGIKIAKSKDDAQKISEATQIAQNMTASLKSMAAFNKSVGTTSPGSVKNAEAAGMRADMLLQIKKLAELGVLSEKDADIIEPLIPNLGGVRTDKTMAQITQVQSLVNNKLKAAYAARLVNPTGLTGSPAAGQDQGTGMSLTNFQRP